MNGFKQKLIAAIIASLVAGSAHAALGGKKPATASTPKVIPATTAPAVAKQDPAAKKKPESKPATKIAPISKEPKEVSIKKAEAHRANKAQAAANFEQETEARRVVRENRIESITGHSKAVATEEDRSINRDDKATGIQKDVSGFFDKLGESMKNGGGQQAACDQAQRMLGACK